MNWILILVFFFSPWPLMARSELDSISLIKLANHDAPNLVRTKALQELKGYQDRPMGPHEVRAAFAWLIACTELGLTEELQQGRALLNQAVDQARALNLVEEHLLLRIHMLALDDTRESSANPLATLELLLQQAEGPGLARARAQILMDLAYHLRERGEVKRALEVQNELNMQLKNPQLDPIDRILIKNQSAITYLQQDLKAEARKLFTDVYVFASEHNLRYLRAIISFNLAKLLYGDNEKPDPAAAMPLLEDSKRLAIELGTRVLEGTARLGLAEALLLQSRFKDAEGEAKAALELAIRTNDRLAEADSHKVKARLYLASHRLAEALTAADEGIRLFQADGYESDATELSKTRAEIKAAMGLFPEAYAVLAKHVTEYRKANEARIKRSFAENMINLNLLLEEEKNRSLLQQNEIQAQEIKAQQRLRWTLLVFLLLAVVISILLAYAVRESRKTARSQQRMRQILDTIEEGILTLDDELRIEPDHSLHLASLIPLDRPRCTFQEALLDHADLPDDEKALIQEVLKSFIHESMLTWELNSAHLPKSLHLLPPIDRHLVLHWTPVIGRHNTIERLLVALRDATTEFELELEIRLEKSRQNFLVERFRTLLSHPAKRVEDLLLQLQSIEPRIRRGLTGEGEVAAIKRTLHSCKGVARALQFKDLSSLIHTFETELSKDPAAAEVQQASDRLGQLLKEYFDLCQQSRELKLDRKSSVPSLASLVSRLLEAHRADWENHRLKLKAVSIHDEVFTWPEAMLQFLEQIFILAIHNSLDHGFIRPSFKADIHFEIRAFQDDIIHIEFADNGHGLDTGLLRRLAAQQGFRYTSDRDLSEVLFIDGVSTAADVSDTSGRGIGLAAVRELCRRHGGDVRISARTDQQGTVLGFSFDPRTFPAASLAHDLSA